MSASVRTQRSPTGSQYGETAQQPTSGTAEMRSSSRRRTVLRWIGAMLVLLVAALTLVTLNGNAPSAREPLHPEHASPEGAKALVRVLDEHGASVTLAHGREASLRLLEAHENSTLVMTAPAVPSDAAMGSIRDLAAAAEHTVFLAADEKLLSEFELGEIISLDSSFNSSFDSSLNEDEYEFVSEPGSEACPAQNFARIGEVRARVFFDPANGVQGCFFNASGDAALLVAPSGSDDAADLGARTDSGTAATNNAGSTVSLIDATELFDNAHLAENGNAALAFALIGGSEQVVWYVPSPEDVAADRVGTIATLTPTWVTPVMVLLILTGIVAGIWRGRRFGPLVEERLPVTVRASETMLGRARLAAHNGDSAHAAAALREGASRRLARRLGLPPTATPEQVGRAVPSEPALTQLLTGPLPSDDAELVRFARALGAILDDIDTQPHPSTNASRPSPLQTPEERSTP